MTLTTTHPRDVQVAEIDKDTTILRSRTWERLKFEAEYARQRGTTANSYLIRGERTALIDPPGRSFTETFLPKLQQHLSLEQLEYIILGHVNPNRMATLEVLIAQAPQATLICSKPGANVLLAAFPQWASSIQSVRSGDTLDLGGGHELQFVTVPTPRWADGLCTYDPTTRILYTDKFFGVHVCDDALFDEDWKQLDGDRRYYFDCLHAMQTKQVTTALDKLEPLAAQCYAPGHGPVVRYSRSRLMYDYRQWCQHQKQLTVALLYASAYGNTATLAGAIAQGLIQHDIAVESINCELADPAEITATLEACDGFIIGSPTLGGHAPVQIQTALGIVLSTAAKTKLAGVFGSYGWSGEAVDLIENKLRDANYRLGMETLRVRFSPTEETLQEAQIVGAKFAQALKKQKKLRSPAQVLTEAQIDRTAQAVGRIAGSVCVLTTRHGDSHQGILTSWVSQATFNPPGLMIALTEEQIDWGAVGDPCVLNILKEGRFLRRHFSERAVPGANPFTSLDTREATNGCLILSDALAYLECTVDNRMQCGDRPQGGAGGNCWLIYAVINQGEILAEDGITAIQHRKSGSHY
ncbi:MAG: diflavin flavoprotein [Cyanophyceae cyanobacterium]